MAKHGWTKKRRQEQSERMKLRAAQQREATSIAAGAGAKEPPSSGPTVLSVDKDGIAKVLMPAEVSLVDNAISYKIGDMTVTIRKG